MPSNGFEDSVRAFNGLHRDFEGLPWVFQGLPRVFKDIPGSNFTIWSRLWNLVEIVRFSWKLLDLIKILKFDSLAIQHKNSKLCKMYKNVILLLCWTKCKILLMLFLSPAVGRPTQIMSSCDWKYARVVWCLNPLVVPPKPNHWLKLLKGFLSKDCFAFRTSSKIWRVP